MFTESMTETINMDGMLLFAHGARDPAWAGPFEAVARHIGESRPQMLTALAYLEFMSPGIEQAAADLVSRGCRRIHILPMFLGASGHVRRDVPPLVDQLRQRWAGQVELILHPAIGEQAQVIQAMGDAALALTDLSAPPPAPTR